MAANPQSSDSYFEINILSLLQRTDYLPADLYIRLGNHYTKICNKNDLVDRTRFENYYKKGVRSLFITLPEKASYFSSSQTFIQGLIQKDITPGPEVQRAMMELCEQAIFDFKSDKLFDPGALEKAVTITENCLRQVTAEGAAIKHLLRLCRQDNYHGMHSIATAVVSNLIAAGIGKIEEPFMHQLTLASLFHDAGLSQLPLEISDPERQLSLQDFEKMKDHCKIGSDILNSEKGFEPQVIQAINQHHENFDGSGYPLGLAGDQISLMARILSLADAFSSLNTSRAANPRLAIGVEALKMIRDEAERFDPKLVAALFEVANKKI